MYITEIESFAELVKRGRYVDKTWFLESFLDTKPDVAVFTRPWRFGKTIFLTMLQEFFDIGKDSTKLFAGLKVAENKALCERWMNRFPVVLLTLKNRVTDFPDALAYMQSLVANACHHYGAEITGSDSVDPGDKEAFARLLSRNSDMTDLKKGLLLLTRVLCQHYKQPVVLLIDKYDTPLVWAAEGGFLDEMLAFMRDFLGNALASNPCLELAVLTGVLPFDREDLFPDIQSLEWHGVSSPSWTTLFGFTQEEVDAILAGSDLLKKRDIIGEWYCGYRFGGGAPVYNPTNIMGYHECLLHSRDRSPSNCRTVDEYQHPLLPFTYRLPPPEIRNRFALLLAGCSVPVDLDQKHDYGPAFLKKGSLLDDDLWEEDTWKKEFWKEDFWKNQCWEILYQTGFLTLANDETKCMEASGKRAALAIPNRELRGTFGYELSEWHREIVPYEYDPGIARMFWEGEAKALEKLMASLMSESTTLSDYPYALCFYQALVLDVLWIDAFPSYEMGEDELIIFPALNRDHEDIAAVIAITRADTESRLDKKVQEALEQIEVQDFDANLLPQKCTWILHWGMAFHKKTCRMDVKICCPSKTP